MNKARARARARVAVACWLVSGCAVYEDQPPAILGGIAALAGAGGLASPDSTAGRNSGIAGDNPVGGTSAGGLPSREMAGASGDEASAEAGSPGAAGRNSGGHAGVGGSGGTGGLTGGSSANGGSAGSSGSPALPLCSEHPLPKKSSWHANASSYFTGETAEVPSLCIDGSTMTRWASGVAQAGNEWLELDLGAAATLDQVTLVLGKSVTDFPVAYEARLSNQSANFAATVLARGQGVAGADTVIAFPAKATGRYLLISQTGHGTSWWSIAEVNLACTD